MNKIISLLIALTSVSLVFSGNTGKIAGVIKDLKTGETLIGVNVLIDGTPLGSATNLEGEY